MRLWRLVISSILIFAALLPVHGTAAYAIGILPPGRVVIEASSVFDSLSSRFLTLRLQESPDAAILAWNVSYLLTGYVAMYEGTGDVRYLDAVWTLGNQILRNRGDRLGIKDALRGTIMPCWCTGKYTGGRQHAFIVDNGMIIFPLARWVYLVKTNNSLPREYLSKAETFQIAVVETARSFDSDWAAGPGPDEGYYEDWVDGKKAVPFNQQNAMGKALLQLWLITGDDFYKTRVEQLARYFKNRLKNTQGRYTWTYWPDGDRSEDISHAAISVDFAFQCYRSGLVFDQNDVAAFVNTFKSLYSKGQGFRYFVDGKGDFSVSLAAAHWGHLGYIDIEVRSIIYQYFSGRWVLNEGLAASSYLVETSRNFQFDRPVNLRWK